MKPPSTRVRRRDLLRGLQRSEPAAVANAGLLRARRGAMGSYFEICLSAATPDGLMLVERALDRVDELEAQMTLYRGDSELCAINRSAHEAPVAVERGLLTLLERAFAIGEATGGAFDVASGALSMAWGFVRGPRKVPSSAELGEALAHSGSGRVRIDLAAGTVAFDRPGVVLNLGSIGKGYAVDEAAAIVREHWWPTGALVQAGRSSVYAVGSPPDRFGGRWGVALHNPFEAEQPLGMFWLRNRGLATSGATYQQFEADGRTYAHIIDPRTGFPPRLGPASVTVLAPTAADADALATAFYLMEPAEVASYCGRNPKVGVVYVLRGAGARPAPHLLTINLDASDFDADPTVPARALAASGAARRALPLDITSQDEE